MFRPLFEFESALYTGDFIAESCVYLHALLYFLTTVENGAVIAACNELAYPRCGHLGVFLC